MNKCRRCESGEETDTEHMFRCVREQAQSRGDHPGIGDLDSGVYPAVFVRQQKAQIQKERDEWEEEPTP